MLLRYSEFIFLWLLASAARQAVGAKSGSGGQGTHPAGSAHRPELVVAVMTVMAALFIGAHRPVAACAAVHRIRCGLFHALALLLLAFPLGSTGLKAAFPPETLRMRKKIKLPRFNNYK